MKKILLAGTALVGVAFAAAPAAAELKLDLGGHFSGYGVYVDEDASVAGQRDFEFRKNTEIHFTGETTLDNGLTVGVHLEQDIENDNSNDESYAYFSGGWGRVNFGNEDGAAYLLQVAAPGADSNVDGLRTTISGFQTDVVSGLDYDHSQFGNQPSITNAASLAAAGTVVDPSSDRLTYLTPKFNGFQAGASYAPEAGLNNGSSPMGPLAAATMDFEDLWEIAVRWDGQFEGVGISAGAGYSTADGNGPSAGVDPTAWNLGFNLAWNQLSFGAVWLEEEDADYVTSGLDTTTWVLGAAWDNGPYHVGASYLNREDEVAGADLESYKATLGGGYTFGPGMTFRGAVAFGETPVAGVEESFTQVTLGTDIQF